MEEPWAREAGVLPVRVDGRTFDLLLADPFGLSPAEDLAFVLNRDVRPLAADPERIEARLRQHYGPRDGDSTPTARELVSNGRVEEDPPGLAVSTVTAQAGDPPVVRFLNHLLGRAIRERASDVHLEPFEGEFRVRCRIDGVLHEVPPPSQPLARSIISRIKVLAGLNIAERRTPQDGRLSVACDGRDVDLRVSTLPTQCGESVVLRVLDPAAVQLGLSQLGMPRAVAAGVDAMVRRPQGIFLVTGPTGSGKTTTLYSALRLINAAELKILTAEDPVEYEIEGITQVPIHPSIGFTFATALRSFLRQDPDVIMVGEIRDIETAQIAIQAALTGHLVLSTLHTNDAAGAVTRLIDMGVEPFLIGATLEAVLAQRLVRRICPDCRKPVVREPASGPGRDPLSGGWEGGPQFQGDGCPACRRTGYSGRTGIYRMDAD